MNCDRQIIKLVREQCWHEQEVLRIKKELRALCGYGQEGETRPRRKSNPDNFEAACNAPRVKYQ